MSGLATKTVRLRMFDFHPVLAGLAETAPLSKPLSFLVEPNQYGPAQEQEGVETEHFLVQPLTAAELEFGDVHTPNKFWAQYYDRYSLPAKDPRNRWQRLVPLRCVPRSFTAHLVTGDPAVKAQVEATVWLWPFGWSSHLQIIVENPLTLSGLKKLVHTIDSAKCFDLEGELVPVSGVFRSLSRQVAGDLYGDPGLGNARPWIPRYMVVSMDELGSLPQMLDATAKARYFDFTESDRAGLHSALLGTEIGIDELKKREHEKTFTWTFYPTAGFGITYFETDRTLLVLHEANEWNGSRAGCLGGNVALCSMMALSLLGAIRFASRSEFKDNPAVKEFTEVARAALLEMPDRYDNPYCVDLFSNHHRLKAWRSGSV
ncbi:MAG TPA: hypothetical protein VF584_26715 [Longimicrobium sp.]|jgi:hypothetical protein